VSLHITMNLNLIHEILTSIKQNKTRSILAGFGVAWGIFILILLLGVGKGFQRGIMDLFSNYSKNSIWFFGGYVSQDVKTGAEGKQIYFSPGDIQLTKARFDDIKHISPEAKLQNPNIYGNNEYQGNFQVQGVMADYFKIKTLTIVEGRNLNALDINNKRRIAVVGERVADVLYPNRNIIGQTIRVNKEFFKVIGIIESSSMFSRNEQNLIYIPYTSFMECYRTKERFKAFCTLLKKESETDNFEKEMRNFLAKKLHFESTDKKALYTMNFKKQTKAFEKLFGGIQMFLWIIGISLLLSGIAGISNIMLVIVKERTAEIGIRKSIGAKPSSILKMIISEAVIITSFAGIIGLGLGYTIITLVNYMIIPLLDKKDMLLSHLGINIPIVITCFVILVLSGIIAGVFPAKKAASIMPVEALQSH